MTATGCQAAFKDVKAKIAKRLQAVADANHYTAKVDKLKQAEVTNPEKATDEEKMARNEEKAKGTTCEDRRRYHHHAPPLTPPPPFYFNITNTTAAAHRRCPPLRIDSRSHPTAEAVRKLEEDTAALMDSFTFYNDQRTALMQERCAWLRTLMQVGGHAFSSIVLHVKMLHYSSHISHVSNVSRTRCILPTLPTIDLKPSLFLFLPRSFLRKPLRRLARRRRSCWLIRTVMRCRSLRQET